jgi:hypothetical protein
MPPVSQHVDRWPLDQEAWSLFVFFGAAVFVSPSLLRLLRKLRLPIGSLRLSEFGQVGPPLLIPIRHFFKLGLSVLSLAKCEPDKSEHWTAPATISQCGYPIDEKAFVISLSPSPL